MTNRATREATRHALALRRMLGGRTLRRDGHHAQGSQGREFMTDVACPFCAIPSNRVIYDDAAVVGIWDAYPVSPGHALIITKRHISEFWEATLIERAALLEGAAALKTIIARNHAPDGFNVGINIGEAAGQTVPHLHLHVIPHYSGDVPDPRGGVRFVIPERAAYPADPSTEPALWIGKAPHKRALVSGGLDDPLLPHLIAHLDRATRVDIAVAFTMDSGVRLLQPYLRDVLAREGQVRIVTGDYFGVTEPDALLRLLDLEGNVELRVFESAGKSFHPKAYIVAESADDGTALVGSSNLSVTALRDGVEWNHRVITARDRASFADVAAGFAKLFTHPNTKPLTVEWIEAYRRRRRLSTIEPSGTPPDEPRPPPEPHGVQREALAKLAQTRLAGNRAGLVVLATGLGKTWLSAFDTDSPDFARILFVAHREEILTQAIETYRRSRSSAVIGRSAAG